MPGTAPCCSCELASSTGRSRTTLPSKLDGKMSPGLRLGLFYSGLEALARLIAELELLNCLNLCQHEETFSAAILPAVSQN